jgi:hypothetical protein
MFIEAEIEAGRVVKVTDCSAQMADSIAPSREGPLT